VLLVTIYVLAGLGLEQVATVFESAAQISPWNPSSGLHFVLLLGFGLRYTPELLLIPLLNMFVVNPLGIAPFYVVVCALWVMLGYSVACALLLHKFHIDPRLHRFRDVFWFATVTLVAPLFVSGLFVATLAQAGSIPWSEWEVQMLRDWAGEATGIAMLAPPLLLLLRAAPWARSHITLEKSAPPVNIGWPKGQEVLECSVEVIALAAAIWLAYGIPTATSLEYSYFVFVPLIWIAVRHGFERAVLAVLSINIGVTLLVHVQSGVNNTLALQFCLLMASYTGLLLGAVVTERKWVEASLRESEQQYQNLYDRAPDAYSSIAADGTIRSINQVGADFLGYRKEELIGQPIWITIHEADRQWSQQWLTSIFREKIATSEMELCKVRKDQSTVWVLERSQLLFDQDGTPTELHVICRDITERKQAEEQLLHNAFHDALTGLPNRTLFMDRLGRALEHSKRHDDYLFAVLFLDLDRFKVINDSLGHSLGDQLLIAIAGRLASYLRSMDTAARLGGDEFTLLLEDISDMSDAIRVAERIQEQLTSPLNLDGQEVFTTASIGIVFSATGYNQSEDLLRDADIAMYRAKALGKARYEIFNPDMRDRAIARLQLETELRRAIEHQEFRIHYQPIVSLATGRVVGFEALVRWQHPDRGLLYPADFMPIAEETSLSISVDQWVLREACRQIQQWQERFPPELEVDRDPSEVTRPLTISVNLGSAQFRQSELLQHINEVLQETNLDATSLKLEITENIILENDESATTMLSQLRELGIQLSIDDFGTGYSSLGRLHRFPIDMLKIDRSFVSKIGVNGRNFEITETIMTLAQKLGVDVTAEGIETAEQLAQLRELNCDYGQGYFFSRPLDNEAAEALITARPQW
jgi:diguanylate cyclase (GGDEF)-like protein/PAS domain S-box-containing protein